jgi:4-amino-4-deoxy-L-arabinose transferase-like glycosyltransferase
LALLSWNFINTRCQEYSQDSKGVLVVLDRIFDLTLGLALFTTILCVGNALSRKFKIVFAGTAEEIAFSIFSGTGAVGLSVLLVGLLGMLRPWPVTGLLLLSAVLARRSFARLYRIISESIHHATLSRETTLVVLLYTALLVLLIFRAATPPNAPDELIYHLPVTKAFVQQGKVYPMFDNSLGNLPFLIHMIYAACLMAGSDIAARLFSLFLAVATTVALYAFCGRYLTRRVGVVSMFAFFAAGMVAEVAITTRIDVSLAGMLFLTTYAMINYLETEEIGWLWASAILGGFSLGIKHSAGIWLLLIGVMYLLTLIRKRHRIITLLRGGLTYAVLCAAIASPWYLKNYFWFHNPVYPLITGEVAEFGSHGIRYFDANDEQRLDAHFNVARSELPDVVKSQEKELTDAISSRVQRHPLRWWEFFLKPNTYLMAEPNHYPNYLFLLIPLLVFLKKPRWVVWLLVLSLGFVLAVTSTTWIARYLLPAYPPLTIVAAYVIMAVSERVHLLRNLPIYLLAGVLGVVVAASVVSIRKFNSLRFVTGSVSRRDVLLPFTYYKPIHFINTQLPPDARVLLVGAQLNYSIERPYMSDESWFATKWRRLLVRNNSLDEVNQDLKRQGFTHILYSPNIFTYAAAMGTQGTGGMDLMATNREDSSDEARRLGPEYQLLRNWSTFTLYQRKYLETVYSDKSHYFVFKIK